MASAAVVILSLFVVASIKNFATWCWPVQTSPTLDPIKAIHYANTYTEVLFLLNV